MAKIKKIICISDLGVRSPYPKINLSRTYRRCRNNELIDQFMRFRNGLMSRIAKIAINDANEPEEYKLVQGKSEEVKTEGEISLKIGVSEEKRALSQLF